MSTEAFGVEMTAAATTAPVDDRPTRARSLPYALGVVFSAAYAVLSLSRYHRFATPSWDNAIFEQAIKAYARLEAPIVPIKGPGFNILGDHFSPVLVLLAPLYRLFPHAQTLLVAQALLVGLSIVPIARVAMRTGRVPAGLAVAVGYGLSFGVQSAVATDFHAVAFAVVLIAFAGEAYVEGRWSAVACWSVPLLLVKEDLGLTVAVIGVVVALAGGRRVGGWLIGAGIVGFALTVLVVVPAFNPSSGYAYWSNALGSGGGPGPLGMFLTGWGTKGPTLLLTFAITGFLALRSPWALIAVPTLGWRFVGDRTVYWGTGWHYSLLVMPVVFVALIHALRLARAGRRRRLRCYARYVPGLVALLAFALCVRFPMGELVRASTYQASDRAVAARAVIALMPVGSSVETNWGLITHLVARYTVYEVATIDGAVADYVLIDTQSGGHVRNAAEFAEKQHPGTTYVQIFSANGYLLAKRTG